MKQNITLTFDLTPDEIATIGLYLNSAIARFAFNTTNGIDDIIPLNCEGLEKLAKKIWDIYNKGAE